MFEYRRVRDISQSRRSLYTGEDNGWSPSASDVVANVPGYRSTVDLAVVISKSREDPVAAEAA